MLLSLSRHIVSWLIDKNAVVEEDRELYEYSAYNLIFTSVPLGGFLIISGMMGYFVNGFLLLASLLAVRRYSGGFHAKTPHICLVISSAILAICLACSVLIKNGLIVGIVVLFSSMGLCILSPVDSENRRLDLEEKRHCKLSARITTCTLYVFYIICSLLGYSSIAVCVAIGITAGGLLQFVCIPRLIMEKNNKNG